MSKLVQSASGMDDATLIKHFNARHMPLGKLTSLRVQFPGEAMLRSYHERIHRLGDEGPGRPVNHHHRGEDQE